MQNIILININSLKNNLMTEGIFRTNFAESIQINRFEPVCF